MSDLFIIILFPIFSARSVSENVAKIILVLCLSFFHYFIFYFINFADFPTRYVS